MRDLTYVSCLLAMALAFALAWGSPFVGAGSAYAPEQAQQQQPGQ
jgi:hypothetical protein